MEILPNLQWIIGISLITIFLFAIASIIFYKMGRNKAINVNNKLKIDKDENSTGIIQIESPKKNGEVIIGTNNINHNENPAISNGKNKKITPSELYAKKIEDEINKKEEGNIEENGLDFKFLKYTSKGYKPAKGDDESGALRWR